MLTLVVYIRKAPLTEEEEALQGIKQAEAEESIGTSSRSSHTSSGVNFPLTNEALQALKELGGGGGNLVQLVQPPLSFSVTSLIPSDTAAETRHSARDS